MAEAEARLAVEFSADREDGNDESVQEHAPSARLSAVAEDAPAGRPVRCDEDEEENGTRNEPAESPAEGGEDVPEDDSDEEERDGGARRAYEDAREDPEMQEQHEETVEEVPMATPEPSVADMAAAFLGEVTKSRGEVDARSIVVYLDEWLASDDEDSNLRTRSFSRRR